MSPFSRGFQLVASPLFPHNAVRFSTPLVHCGLRIQRFDYASSSVASRSTQRKAPAQSPPPRSLPKQKTRPATAAVVSKPTTIPIQSQEPNSATPKIPRASQHTEERILFQVNRNDDLRMLLATRFWSIVFMLYPYGMLNMLFSENSLADFSQLSQYGFYGLVAIMETVGIAYWTTTWHTATKITAIIPRNARASGLGIRSEAATALLRIEGRGYIPFRKYAVEVPASDVTKSFPLEQMSYDMLSMYQGKEAGHLPISEVSFAVRPFARMGRAFRRFYWSFRQGLMREGRVFLDLHGKEKGRWRVYPANGALRVGNKGIDQLVPN